MSTFAPSRTTPVGPVRSGERRRGATPREVLASWPAEAPLAVLASGRFDPRWGRWTVLARPGEAVVAAADDPDPLRHLARLEPSADRCEHGAVPFTTGWIGWIGYECGRLFEPEVARGSDRAEPLVERWPRFGWWRVEDALVHDGRHDRWYMTGRPPEAAVVRIRAGGSGGAGPNAGNPRDRFRLGRLEPRHDPDAARAAIARVVEFVRSGDIFQANVTHPFAASFAGDPRACFEAAWATAQPWYAAYLEVDPRRQILSLSPELFLERRAGSRLVRTRPIKGTRPASLPAERLRESAKDEAELAMIVDLMRNDLGRVAELGSVRVEEARAIETHPTVHHGVATVSARVARGVSRADLLAAAFPPGSITGAPKIRAMQIIEGVERGPRGPYCGAVGWLGDEGGLVLNVAIRTLLREDAVMHYHAGGGIVADSDPDAEYEEALDKTAVVRALALAESRSGSSSE